MTEGEQKVISAWMHEFTGLALMCAVQQKASHSVALLTGSFLPRLQRPSVQPGFALQFMNIKSSQK